MASLLFLTLAAWFCVSKAAEVEINADGTISSPLYWTCLHEESLVAADINHKVILDNHNKSCENGNQRYLDSKISLAFVTPWHRKGYKWTERYYNKFTHVSPTWFKLSKFPKSDRVLILGDNDVDKHWMQKLRSLNSKIKIIPRFHFENDWSQEDIAFLVSDKSKQIVFLSEVFSTIERNNLDGIVLEMTPFFSQVVQLYTKIYKQNQDATSQAQMNIDPNDATLLKKLKKRLNNFVTRVGKRFRKAKKDLFIVMSPYYLTFLKTLSLDAVAKYATGLPIMSYDYALANIRDAGPNAPIEWLNQVIMAAQQSISSKYHSKILLGLNFYGYKWGFADHPRSAINSDILDTIENESDQYQWVFDQTSYEHYLQNVESPSMQIYYPTLISISKRLELAKQYGIGISIWELGQGLEYFCELL